MKLWTITTQGDDGTKTAVHTSEAQAVAQWARIVAASWVSVMGDKPMPDNTRAAYEILTDTAGFVDFVQIESHTVTDSDECRAALGQLLEQVYQMHGLFPDDDGAIQRAVEDAEAALEEPPAKFFTVWVTDANEHGTHFVQAFQAVDIETAKAEAIAECADCWGYDPADLHILGVADGNVHLLEWDEGAA